MLSNDFFFPFEIGLVVFALCTGLAIIASGALPKWLGWVMVVIGIVAFTPDRGDLERLAEHAPGVRAAVPHAQLLVLPELHLAAVPGLLDESDGYADSVAVAIPGTLTERLGEIAAAANLWIVAGSVYERSDEGAIHNTAIVVGPDGALAARYRKVFPWRPTEHSAPGDGFVTFDIPEVGRIGWDCYDGFFEVIAALVGEVVIADLPPQRHARGSGTGGRVARTPQARARA